VSETGNKAQSHGWLEILCCCGKSLK